MTITIDRQRITAGPLRRYRQRRAVRAALGRAYTTFSGAYPQWRDSLFDRHLIERVIAPWLDTPERAGKALTAYVLATAWADQISMHPEQRRRLEALCVPIAGEFLRLLAHELPATSLLPLYVARSADQLALGERPAVAPAPGGHHV